MTGKLCCVLNVSHLSHKIIVKFYGIWLAYRGFSVDYLVDIYSFTNSSACLAQTRYLKFFYISAATL